MKEKEISSRDMAKMVDRNIDVFEAIALERCAQVEKWGEQSHSLPEWFLILGEEIGEAQKATWEYISGFSKADSIESLFVEEFEKDFFPKPLVKQSTLEDVKNELVQVAAVIVAMIEAINRGLK